jgi:predicted RNase H-like nuclease (RuvC/YqgF family)
VNCQHCGSASRSDWGYECGSSSSVGFERSIRCRTKEISNIRQELEESNNRIKRLEEALAWYEYTVSNCYCHGSEGDAARDALRKDQGRKAKEAKL